MSDLQNSYNPILTDVKKSLVKVQDLLKKYDANAQHRVPTWANVGDLIHTEKMLKEIIEFFN